MKLQTVLSSIFIAGLSISTASIASEIHPVVQPNLDGIEIPENYKDWPIISISHRTDNQTIRAIIGNNIAIQASRSGNTNPWPEGSILGKLVWKEATKTNWPTAVIPNPNKFIHAEFMYKDTDKFKENGTNWGWARWLGQEQTPYGNAKNLDQSCIKCHTPVKGQDWVFTSPIKLP